jgi:hypothetical protein
MGTMRKTESLRALRGALAGLGVLALLSGFPPDGEPQASAKRGPAAPDELVGLVVLLRFRDQDSLKIPPREFIQQALDLQIGDFYGHVTDWKVKPMRFLVTEYFTPSKPFVGYDWWSKGNWENHFDLLREVSAGLVAGTIRAPAVKGGVGPVDLGLCSKDGRGKILSAGTTYFVDAKGSAGVIGRANGNEHFWPQTKEVEDALRTRFSCRLGSYSSGFVVGTYGRFDDPEKVDVGAQVHEIGHAFLGWPDIDPKCHGYGNDWEIVKRISTHNKSGPSAKIRELNEVPGGSTVSVAAGDWDVWGFRNARNPGEYIVFENVAAKGYTWRFCRDHPGKNLLLFRLDTRKQSQVNVEDLAKASWGDGSPVDFSISDVSPPGDVMSFRIRSSAPGSPRDCGTAGGGAGYPVELYERPDLIGRVGAFGKSKYYASWMPRMGIEPGLASAVKILPGYKVTLFEGSRLQGRSCALSNPGPAPATFDLTTRQFAGKTSSLVVEPIPLAGLPK